MAEKAPKQIGAVGKRKTSIARIWMTSGGGNIIVNGRELERYFGRQVLRILAAQPLVLTDRLQSYDFKVNVEGGGLSGQAEAIKYGIAKALMAAEPKLRGVLKKAGFLKRDDRIVERKKYGRAGARKRFQFSKR